MPPFLGFTRVTYPRLSVTHKESSGPMIIAKGWRNGVTFTTRLDEKVSVDGGCCHCAKELEEIMASINTNRSNALFMDRVLE